MSLTIELPLWLEDLNREPRRFSDESDAMRFVIALSARNVADGGGPFAAAVLDEDLNLVAAGVNRVVASRSSLFHAEMLALLLAQQKRQTHDLASCGRHVLVTSCEPCAMCLGAIPWSGVVRVICAARGADAEAIGFDEGAKPELWRASLEQRGISVVTGLCRDEADAVLRRYQAQAGQIY